jgi:hypothetical protein
MAVCVCEGLWLKLGLNCRKLEWKKISLAVCEVKRLRKENDLDCIKTSFYTFHSETIRSMLINGGIALTPSCRLLP